MKQAILMARVSSQEQAKGYSLDIQSGKLTGYCVQNKIQVIDIYKEDRSAKDFNRPEFKKLLLYIKANNNKVDLLLVTTWDRFSRNYTESVAMIEELRLLGCEVQAIDQPLDLSVPENLMIMAIYLTLPQIDNQRRSIKIKEGVRAARRQGRWIGCAPFGYKLVRIENNKAVLIENEKAAIVREIFNSLRKGIASSVIRQILNKKGTYFSKSTFSDLCRSRLYIGKIFVRDDSPQKGYYVNGIHKALITEKLFYEVQDILNDKKSKKDNSKPKCFNENFVLRGLIKCDSCGEHLTGSTSKGRNGLHSYYHCNHCGRVRIRTEDANQRMELIFEEMTIDKNAKKLYDIMVRQILKKNVNVKKRPIERIENEISQNLSRIRKLEDSFADGDIDAAVMRNGIHRYNSEIEKYKREIENNTQDLSLHTEYLNTGIDLLSEMGTFYRMADSSIKRHLIGSIFPEKVYFSKNKSRTAEINEAAMLILNASKCLSKNKTGQLFHNLQLSRCVEQDEKQYTDNEKKIADFLWSLAQLSVEQFLNQINKTNYEEGSFNGGVSSEEQVKG